jgi:hypothetical protein
MITPASVAFGMYANVEVRRPSVINTITPKTQSLNSYSTLAINLSINVGSKTEFMLLDTKTEGMGPARILFEGGEGGQPGHLLTDFTFKLFMTISC